MANGRVYVLDYDDLLLYWHAMMADPNAVPLRFDDNPPRQDIEEMGRMIGVQLALNSVVNESKQIVTALAGDPGDVIRQDNRQPVKDVAGFETEIRKAAKDKSILFLVERGDARVFLAVRNK